MRRARQKLLIALPRVDVSVLHVPFRVDVDEERGVRLELLPERRAFSSHACSSGRAASSVTYAAAVYASFGDGCSCGRPPRVVKTAGIVMVSVPFAGGSKRSFPRAVRSCTR